MKATARVKALTKIETAAPLPSPAKMARVIHDVMEVMSPSHQVFKSPEPYRAIMHLLGYENMDGTPWWDKVMDVLG